ncbi:hypothetical protein [Desulfoluna spongiiphila]|uniref:hypothetical protein n=1 Tax=Desulfoluna spongiiphila TaxID=419481 RepID=UPI001253C817|nr:hypothetical protein [Desulfoluna spongiiphila]VVS94978.1 p-loop containing nucleoside triphosphate hydrolase [Desulfoluna spongiiphila]
MIAHEYDIKAKTRTSATGVTDINDFELESVGCTDARQLLNDPGISLYAMDTANQIAVFVDSGTTGTLFEAPFYYMAQYEAAERVFTISFDIMIHLAHTIDVESRRLIFIFSTGRAGSTLAGRVFSQIEDVVTISEPDVLTALLDARLNASCNDLKLKELLVASVRLLCAGVPEKHIVIKVRGSVIELCDWLIQCFPDMKSVFLYRDAESWLSSSMRAFVGSTGDPDKRVVIGERAYRSRMARLVPMVARFDEGTHLSYAGILSLIWLSVMERYMKLRSQGIEMPAIPFKNWLNSPLETSESMLEYCGCRPDSMETVCDVLFKDSQAGSHLSKKNLLNRKATEKKDVDELKKHLSRHPFINRVDFEVPGSLCPC